MKFTDAKKFIVVCYLLVAYFAASTVFTGCQNAPRAAYTVAKTTTITVEAALSGPWAAYVKAHHPPKEVEKHVATAFQHYKEANIALLHAGKGLLSAQQAQPPNPDRTDRMVSQWQTAAAELVTAANGVYELLRTLGVKLQ